jgi:hypothetical protein
VPGTPFAPGIGVEGGGGPPIYEAPYQDALYVYHLNESGSVLTDYLSTSTSGGTVAFDANEHTGLQSLRIVRTSNAVVGARTFVLPGASNDGGYGTAFEWTFWLYANTLPSSATHVEIAHMTFNLKDNLQVRLNSAGELRLGQQNNTQTNAESMSPAAPTAISAGSWFQVTVTIDFSGETNMHATLAVNLDTPVAWDYSNRYGFADILTSLSFGTMDSSPAVASTYDLCFDDSYLYRTAPTNTALLLKLANEVPSLTNKEYDSAVTTGGTVALSTAQAHSGTQSVRVNKTSAAACYAETCSFTLPNLGPGGLQHAELCGSFWVYVASRPSGVGDTIIMTIYHPVNDNVDITMSNTGAVKIRRQNGTLAGGADQSSASATSVPLNTWTRIFWTMDGNTGTLTATVAVGSDTPVSVSWSQAAEVPPWIDFGSRIFTDASNYDIYYDDQDVYEGLIYPAAAATATQTPISVGGTITSSSADAWAITLAAGRTAGTITPSAASQPKRTITLAAGRTAGTITPAGTETRQTAKPLTGATTPTGALAKSWARTLTGTVAPTGALAKSWARTLTGTVAPTGAETRVTTKVAFTGSTTPAGALTVSKTYPRSFSGSTTPAGALAKSVGKALTGTVTSAGTESRSTGKALTGTVTSAGTVKRSIGKLLAGTVAPTGAVARAITFAAGRMAGTLGSSGALARQWAHLFSGATTPAGAEARTTGKLLAGTITSAGALAVTHTFARTLTGSITPTGAEARTTSKPLAGTLTSVGTETRQTAKKPTGTIAPTGALTKSIPRALTGTLAPAGAETRQTAKKPTGAITPTASMTAATARALSLTASIASSGALRRSVAKSSGGTVAPTGALAASRTVALTLTGTVTSAGAVTKQWPRTLTGQIAPAGALTRTTPRTLAGTLTSAGAVARSTARTQSGTIAPTGAASKSISQSFAGTLTSIGTLRRSTGKLLAGTLTSAGALATNVAQRLNVGGTLTSAGTVSVNRATLVALAGTLTSSGAVKRTTTKLLAGTVTSAGTVTRVTSHVLALAGQVAPSGTQLRSIAHTVTGTLTSSATVGISRAFLKAVGGTLTSAGTVARSASKTFAGTSLPTGALTRSATAHLAGTIAPVGSVAKSIPRAFSGALTSSGSLVAGTLHQLVMGGTLASAGSMIRSRLLQLLGLLSPTGDVDAEFLAAPPQSVQVPGLGPTVQFGVPTTSTEVSVVGDVTAAASVNGRAIRARTVMVERSPTATLTGRPRR